MTNYINKKMVLVGILVVAVGLLITWLVVDYWNAGFTAGETPKLEDVGVEVELVVTEDVKPGYDYYLNIRFEDGNYRRIKMDKEPMIIEHEGDEVYIVYVGSEKIEKWHFCGDNIEGIKLEIVMKEVG